MSQIDISNYRKTWSITSST